MSAITAFTSPDVTLAYNEVNQVTSMSDPVLGTTAFGYTAAGHLETENGPWDSDTVTMGYHATAPGLRTGLTVQRPSGTWAQTYGYDDEQRLKSVETDTYATPDYFRWKTEFVYDGRGRLRVRKEYIWVSGAWSLNTQTRYVYDGMRVVQERNSSNTPTVAYTRGLDLSSSLEGAGGIGGLLARSHGYSGGNWSTHNCYHADGNGNVTYLMASGQTMVATYKYDPYGRTVSQSGTLATANVYRFSSKDIHANSGFYYYGYRFYDPATQRWLNRDPLALPGFSQLNARSKDERVTPNRSADKTIYTFVRNSPSARVDPFGLICGSGSTEKIVDDSPFGFDFSSACEAHDACYSTCQPSPTRKQCDDNFLEDMHAICETTHHDAPLCHAAAEVYYTAVDRWGGKAYRQAQKECEEQYCERVQVHLNNVMPPRSQLPVWPGITPFD